MQILFIGVFLLVVILIVGRIHFANEFSRQVKSVFAEADLNSYQTFEISQLEGLPPVVQQYFLHVLKPGQPLIRCARLRHNGQFKPGLKKSWGDIEGEQYFSTIRPAYIWKGDTNLFSARDFYIGGKGGLIVTILSLFNVLNAKGKAFDQGELLRWLMENIWFPTNLLPGENMAWTSILPTKARLSFEHLGLSLYLDCTFNEAHEIIEMETKRNMDETRMETWIGRPASYKEMNGVRIPTDVEVLWRLPEGDLSYARFHVLQLEYNIAAQY